MRLQNNSKQTAVEKYNTGKQNKKKQPQNNEITTKKKKAILN